MTVTKGKGKIYRLKGQGRKRLPCMIYIDVVISASEVFPFVGGEDLRVQIVGNKLVLEREMCKW